MGTTALEGPVVLRLAPRIGIYGRLTIPDRLLGAAHFRVVLAAIRPGPDPDDAFFMEHHEDVWVYPDNPNWSFFDLRPGAYHLVAMLSDRVLLRERVTVGESPLRFDLALPDPPRSEVLVLRVEGPDGAPVGDVQVQILYRDDSSNTPEVVARPPLLPDGTIAIPLPAVATRSDRLTVIVRNPEYGEQVVEIPRSEAPEAHVRFEEPAFIEVCVEGAERAEAAGRLMVIDHGDWVEVGAGGRRRVGPEQPGPRWVTLDLDYHDHDLAVHLDSRELTLRSGLNEVNLVVPPLHDVTVIVPNGVEGAVIAEPMESCRGWHMTGRAEGGGRVVFSDLPPGRYSLRASIDGEAQSMEVDVPTAAPVSFEPPSERPARLRVSISDPGGPLARAGLEDGDLVLGVDGVRFENRRHMWALWGAACAAAAAKLTILRAGDTIEMDVTLSGLPRPDEWGGDVGEAD